MRENGFSLFQYQPKDIKISLTIMTLIEKIEKLTEQLLKYAEQNNNEWIELKAYEIQAQVKVLKSIGLDSDD